MTNIIIDPEIKSYIRALKAHEYNSLEDNILEKGCLDPLKVWEGHDILLDGHNRYSICEEHDIDYNIEYMVFDTLEDVLDWMIDNQLGRRNLTADEMSYLRGLKYNRVKQGHGTNRYTTKMGQSDLSTTSEVIAEETGTSGSTIKRDGVYADSVDTLARALGSDVRNALLSGNIPATRKDVQELAARVKSEPEAIEAVIETAQKANVRNTREAEKLNAIFASADERFMTFIELHSHRSPALWRVEMFAMWYEQNHSEHSKFEQVEMSGILHFDIDDDIDCFSASYKVIRNSEKRWAKIRQQLEIDARKMDDIARRETKALEIEKELETEFYLNGDCVELLLDLAPGTVKLLLTDPPYGVGWQSNRRVKSAKSNRIASDDSPADAVSLLFNMLESIDPAMQDDCHILIFTSQDNYPLFRDTITNAGYKCGRVLTWVKENHTSGDLRVDFAPQTEWIIHAWRGRPELSPRISEVLQYSRDSKTSHPTEKPIALLSKLIEVTTIEGELVIDPFAGTGSTVDASLSMGRNVLGIELDNDWFNEGVIRLNTKNSDKE